MAIGYDNGLDDMMLYERVEHLAGGMNTFARASLLPPEVCQLMQDLVIKDNGIAETRPGILAKTAIAGASRILGLGYLDTPSAESVVVAARVGDPASGSWVAGGGSPWAWTPLATGKNDGFTAMAQGGGQLYISDGSNQWQRYDGATLSAALGSSTTDAGDPPVGATILAWHTHRMFAVSATTPDLLLASDIGDAGSGKWKHVTFGFRVGHGEGQNIVALAPMQDFWLAVIKSGSVWLVRTDPQAASAAEWTAQKVTDGIGGVARRGAVMLGNDCLFMAQDGVRSLRRMAGAAGQYEVTAPISQAIQSYIDRINWASAGGICAASYRQYALFAVPLDGSSENNAVLVWNGRLNVWAGVWTNWEPTVFGVSAVGDAQRLLFGDATGAVQEWQDNADPELDTTYQDNGTDVLAVLRGRGWIFGEPVNAKDGSFLEVRMVRSAGTVQVNLFYDDAQVESWTESLPVDAVTLPVDLPFMLPSVKPVTLRKAVDHLGEFYEAMAEIKAVSGRLAVKTLTLAAFLNTVQNDEL